MIRDFGFLYLGVKFYDCCRLVNPRLQKFTARLIVIVLSNVDVRSPWKLPRS